MAGPIVAKSLYLVRMHRYGSLININPSTAKVFHLSPREQNFFQTDFNWKYRVAKELAQINLNWREGLAKGVDFNKRIVTTHSYNLL